MRKYLIIIFISLVNTIVVNAQCNSKNDVAGTAGQAGLYGEYFAGYFNDVPGFFPSTISTTNRIESNLNYVSNNWGIPIPPAGGTAADQDLYSSRYRGSINIATAGTYTFYLTSDDASYLFLDNDALAYPVSLSTALINNGGTHSSATVSNSIFLTAGYHNIQIIYGENGGGNVLTFEYAAPGLAVPIARTVVPNSVLCTGIQPFLPPPSGCVCKDVQGNASTSGLLGQYYAGYFNDVQSFFTTNTPGLNRTDNSINFNTDNWGAIVPPATGSIADPNTYSTRWTGAISIATAGTYTFYLTSDDASYLWFNNNAVTATPTTATATINNGGLHGATAVSASIALPAGINYIKVHFGENTGNNRCILEYENIALGITRQPVPNSILCSSFLPPEPTVPSATVNYCQNAVASALSATGSNLLWYTVATGGVGSATAITPVTTAAGTISYYVSQTVGGCEGLRAKIDVVVTATPSATISYAGSPFCKSLAGAQAVTQTGTTGGSYSSTAGLTIVAATGAVTPSSSTAGPYTVTYTIPAAGGCALYSTTTNITITAVPSATISYAGTPYCGNVVTAQAVTQTGTGGGSYSSTAGLTINAATGAITPSTSTPGPYVVTYTVAASGGCAIYTTTTNITIATAPSATINYAGSPFCKSLAGAQSVTRTGTAGGSYSSTGGLTINAVTGDITPSSSTAGPYVVTYTIAAAAPCPAYTTTANVTITAVPSATISYSAASYCTSATVQSVTQTGTNGGSYSSTAGLTINAATGDITPSTSTAGPYVVTYTVAASGGCAIYTTTTNVAIAAAPSATINYAGSPFCKSLAGAQSVTRTGTAGGSYSSTGGLTINAVTGDITPSSSTAGPYVVTYTIAAAAPCPAYTTTANVTITAVPSATIAYSSPSYCTTSAVQSVTQTGTGGGTYSSTGGLTINAATGAITPSTSTAGPYVVTYTVAASGGCALYTTTTNVTITAAPSATISYSSPSYCTTAAVQSVTQTGTGGGTYSSTGGLTINAATGAITPSTSTAGPYVVTYTVAASGGCALYTTTTNVTITAAPSATISYSSPSYCTTAAVQSVTQTGTSGGSYSSTAGLTINAATGAITPLSSTAGPYVITYTIAASGGCALYTTTTNVTITAAPSATISYSAPSYCTTAAVQSVTQTGTGGGSYSSTAGLTINSATGDITPSTSTAGPYVITYTIAASGGCALYTMTTNITITAAPSATISYSSPSYCSTDATVYTVTQTGTGGGTYSSTGGLTINAATGDITPSTSTAGPYVITYTVAASGGCVLYSTTTNVTITTAPSATISYSSPSYCSTDATVYTVTQTGTGGGTYSSTVGLIINAATGAITPSTSSAGPYVITYTIAASGGCALYTTTANVTITTAPSATISYSASTYCSTDATVYTVTQTGTGGGSYSSTGGLTINSATGDITPSTSTAGPYVVTYTVAASGGCVLYSTITNVTITAAPNATISYSSPSYCTSAGVQSVTQTGTGGGTYSSAAGLTINAATGDITPSSSTAGPYTITYTVAASGGCALYTTTTSVVMDPLPVITLDPVDQTVCQNTTATFSVTATGSSLSYQWRKNGVAIVGATNPGFSIPSATSPDAGTYDVVVTNSCLVSVTSAGAILTINTNPTFTLNPVDIVICSGTSGTLVSGATGTGLTFQWMKFTSPITTIVGATSSSYTINPASLADAGTYYVVISGSCGSSVPSTAAQVNISNNVSVSVPPSDATVCTGTGASFSVSANGPVSGYQWQFGGVDIVGATSSTYSIASAVPSDAGSYGVVVSGSCGTPVTSASATLTVNGGLPLVLSKTDECGSSSGTGIISFTSASAGLPYGFSVGALYTGSMPPTTASTNVGSNPIPVTGGQYTVRLYDPGSGCYGDQTITVGTNIKPSAFVFSIPNNTLCVGDTAQSVLKLQGSQVGIDYKFIHTSLLGVSDTSALVSGTGGVISFPPQSLAGSYVVYGYNISDTTCKTTMSGTHSISLNPKPVISGVTSGCVGGGGSGSLNISASIVPSGSLEYSINGIIYQPTGLLSSLANGIYTVYVRDASTQCSDTAFNEVVYCNLAPVVLSDFSCSYSGNVLLNDVDPDGNVLKATSQLNVLTAKGGHLSLDTLGNYSYTPPSGFTGFDTASYTVCDKVVLPLCSTSLLVIKTGSGGIHAWKDTSSTRKDEPLSSTLSVLSNDYTDDGDSIYLQKVSNVNTIGGGKVSISSTGQYSYQPGPGFVGVDSYIYTIKDRCGNVSTASLEITVIETLLKKIFIPEGFSPNGDGSHDLFEIGNAEGYKIKIKVFNRWGSLVYEQNDYKAPGWWDGNSNTGLTLGDRLPDGTYFYEIETDAGDKYVRYLTLKR